MKPEIFYDDVCIYQDFLYRHKPKNLKVIPLELEEQFSGILTYLIEEPFLFSGNGDLEGDQWSVEEQVLF